MIYMAEISTPANTPATDPLITRLRITKGLIYKFHLYCPHGAMGYHYVQVYDGSYQLYPSSLGVAFRGDGFEVDFDDLYLKTVEPFELQIKTWNIDETYEHLAWVQIGQVSEESFMARFLPGITLEKMAETLAKIAAAQEEEKARILAEPFSWVTKETRRG